MKAFLLTRQWRDRNDGVELNCWFATEYGPRLIKITQQEAVIFVRQSDLSQLEKYITSAFRVGAARFLNFRQESVVPVYFNSHRLAREADNVLARQNIPVWEVDIRPPERYLMERFITAAAKLHSTSSDSILINPKLSPSDYRPQLKIVSIDIETSFDAKQLYSVGVYCGVEACDKLVFMVGGEDCNEGDLQVRAASDEIDCLRQFFNWLKEYDPDVLIGWNFIQFDLWVLETICRRLNLSLDLGRGGEKIHWRTDEDNNRHYIQIPGRVALDGIEVLRGATYNFPSFSLGNVAKTLLGEGKLLQEDDRASEISDLFNNDKLALAQYNIKDCQLVWDIFKHAKLMEYVIERSQLTGLLMDKNGGSVAAFDYLYLPRLHRLGYIAPNLGEQQSNLLSPGGYVLNSQPGIFRNVLVLDFKSLYPSIIRTFCIDPYGYWVAQKNELEGGEVVPGKRGAFFSKQDHILPDIFDKLWKARDKAKKDNNQPLSQAIKIIMNSFYGVLGSTGCRFYDPRVCSSITLRGHEIIQQTKDWLESENHQVIYGDTDSVFVWVGNDLSEQDAVKIGRQLAEDLNQRWQTLLREQYTIDCALEIEFETHYLQFLMPTIRNSSAGSKKRYAGIINKNNQPTLVFKGLENVRTDWTDLAKQFQEEVFRRVFADEPVKEYVRAVFEQVRTGEKDQSLVYRKRLRRKLVDYQKNVPPHVQAARKLQAWTGTKLGRGDWISYLITVNGPEPVDALQSPIDYHHYIDRQLAPVADSVLQFINLSFDGITARQRDLFN